MNRITRVLVEAEIHSSGLMAIGIMWPRTSFKQSNNDNDSPFTPHNSDTELLPEILYRYTVGCEAA